LLIEVEVRFIGGGLQSVVFEQRVSPADAWLDAVGSSISVQQGLMRASVQTAMGVYGG
jgi:hypothetical protein